MTIQCDSIGTNLGDLLREKGFKTERDKIIEKIDEALNTRREEKDLVYISWNNWKQFLINHPGSKFNDSLLTMDNNGVYTSRKIMEEVIDDVGKTCEFVWDKENNCWNIKNLIESTKANSLINLINNAEIKPIDSKVTTILSEVNSLKEDQIHNVVKVMIENIIAGELSNQVNSSKLNKLKKLNKLLGEIHGK